MLPAFLLLDLGLRGQNPRAAPGWRVRALLVTSTNVALSLAIGAAWARMFGGRSVFDGHVMGMTAGALVGVLTYELAHYAYHRAAHRFDVLWRMGHQMHHSAETLDAWGAYYLHPLDAAAFTSLSSLVLYPLLGLSPEAGALAAAMLTFASVFQHADVRTPRWLGYIVQRPESHAVHHARGVHAHNYADLPLWDIVFGTFSNPAAQEQPTQGFYDGASRRVRDMLLFQDVSRPRAISSGTSSRRESRPTPKPR
ncbi:sterol desaturase family protein [Variovorax sp. LjRoot178]|uniref:sterol desaturase family protein n=1 Tax=Variovorax sp. LjRoot178 TaxID=3342277 RepID=UPI003ECD175D